VGCQVGKPCLQLPCLKLLFGSIVRRVVLVSICLSTVISLLRGKE
jgi:hypothetical protein